MERHVIYNVNKEEYDTCRILSDSPRIIGFCTEPTRERLFTISFRSFSPMPKSIEYERGKSYYFISTSSPGNLLTRQGGYCTHNNMKVTAPYCSSDRTAYITETLPCRLSSKWQTGILSRPPE